MSWKKLAAIPYNWKIYYPLDCVGSNSEIFCVVSLKLYIFNIVQNSWEIIDLPDGNVYSPKLALMHNKLYMACKNFDNFWMTTICELNVHCFDITTKLWQLVKQDLLQTDQIGIVSLYRCELILLVNGSVLKYSSTNNTWTNTTQELPLYSVDNQLDRSSVYLSERIQWASLPLPHQL